MKASELLKGLQYSVICGDEDIEIKEIYNDSRKVGAQGLFFCIVGLFSINLIYQIVISSPTGISL